MTPAEHAAAIRAAADALNRAVARAAASGVTTLIRVEVVASAAPAIERRVEAVPYLRL